MVTFQGERGVKTYTAIALKSGLKLYHTHKIKPNRAWTPTAMLVKAGSITGHQYRRGEYQRAIADLENWLLNNATTGV